MNLGNDIQTSAIQKNFPQCWRHPASALSPGEHEHMWPLSTKMWLV